MELTQIIKDIMENHARSWGIKMHASLHAAFGKHIPAYQSSLTCLSPSLALSLSVSLSLPLALSLSLPVSLSLSLCLSLLLDLCQHVLPAQVCAMLLESRDVGHRSSSLSM